MSTRQAVRSLRQITNGRPFSTVVDDRMAMAAGSSPLPRTGNVLQDAMRQTGPRHDWSKDEIREIYKTPLMELAHQSVGTRAVWI
jgi:biotin synthase